VEPISSQQLTSFGRTGVVVSYQLSQRGRSV